MHNLTNKKKLIKYQTQKCGNALVDLFGLLNKQKMESFLHEAINVIFCTVFYRIFTTTTTTEKERENEKEQEYFLGWPFSI